MQRLGCNLLLFSDNIKTICIFVSLLSLRKEILKNRYRFVTGRIRPHNLIELDHGKRVRKLHRYFSVRVAAQG